MKNVGPEEHQIVGRWITRDGGAAPDENCRRIDDYLASGRLKEIGQSVDGWTTLYADLADGDLWELSYPESGLSGGGPPTLTKISPEEAERRFHRLN